MRGRPRIPGNGPGERRFTPTNDELVAALIDENPILEKGRKTLRKELLQTFPELGLEDLPEFNRVPDAYRIFPKQRRVDVFEVEVTHAIPLSLMATYGRLRDCLLGCDIHLDLYVVNRYGHVAQLDVQFWWLKALSMMVKSDVPDGG